MSEESTVPLFSPSEVTCAAPPKQAPATKSAPRLRCANRRQLLLRPVDLDATISADHQARTLWRFVEQLDLSRFLEPIEAREGEPGRDATDPRILVTLWLYATTRAVGSARELARLCEEHDAYRWICGGVTVNYHLLSDFRVSHGQALDALLTQVLAVMMKQNLVTLDRMAQDGTRARASAGAASFRREARLSRVPRRGEGAGRAREEALRRPDGDGARGCGPAAGGAGAGGASPEGARGAAGGSRRQEEG